MEKIAADFETGEMEQAFAEKRSSLGAAGFAMRRGRRGGNGPAGRLKKRMGSGADAGTGIINRSGKALAARLQSGGTARFAARILERRPSLKRDGFHGTLMIHMKRQQSAPSMNNVQKILLQFQKTWNQSILSEQKRFLFRNAVAQSVVMRMERYLDTAKIRHIPVSEQKEMTVFRDIATIFVNRGSRPDLAKKAERELVKVLSREFYERGPDRGAEPAALYQKKNVQEELVMTKRTVTRLEEQVEQQKTILTELNRKMESAVREPEWDAGKITAEVMKRMEREMHLERLRRGI